jgi:hypothetical protein
LEVLGDGPNPALEDTWSEVAAVMPQPVDTDVAIAPTQPLEQGLVDAVGTYSHEPEIARQKGAWFGRRGDAV